jgi:hypothetical protein
MYIGSETDHSAMFYYALDFITDVLMLEPAALILFDQPLWRWRPGAAALHHLDDPSGAFATGCAPAEKNRPRLGREVTSVLATSRENIHAWSRPLRRARGDPLPRRQSAQSDGQ